MVESMDVVIAEFFNPGQRLTLLLEMPRELGETEIKSVEQELNGRGLKVKLVYGSTPEWPHALNLELTRPEKVGTSCPGAIPVAAHISSVLSLVGIGKLARWRVAS